MIARALPLAALLAACSPNTPATAQREPIVVPTSPAVAAARACQEVRGVLEAVTRNAAAGEVRGAARRASQLADAAADRDARWVQLAAAVRGLEQSLQVDDGRLAGTSTVVLLHACRTAGVAVDAGSDDGLPRVDAP